MPKQGEFLVPAELASDLRACLPPSIERRCILGNKIVEPYPCAQHLAALLRTVSTYLPRQVAVPLLAKPESGKVQGEFIHGTVMFADISGFTAMSEKLSQLGKQGAEEITAIVNRFFAALLEVTDYYGGDLLKFGGDALIVFFGGEGYAHRACLAAIEMQNTMSSLSEISTSQGEFRLRMSIGLGTGPLFVTNLGSAEGMEFTIMGQAMAQMAQAEDRASAGEIFIDAATWQAIADHATVEETKDSYYQLLSFYGDVDLSSVPKHPLANFPPPPTGKDLLPWIANTVRQIQALALFLPPGLMDKISLEPERIVIGGEYRPVTVFFANFYGINEIIHALGKEHSAEITAILNAHFTTMRQIIARYGGVVNKVDTYAIGHRIMALFGAPRAHIDDPERAVRAALEMQDAMASFAELHTSCGTFCLKQRVGINTGLVFAGNVGSLIRQEYSVMGDEVNLAARLMAVATEGQVIISQSTARQSGSAFLLQEQEPVHVKGKSLAVHNYQVLGLLDTQRRKDHLRERHPMIGRDDEWKAIQSVTDLSLTGETHVLTIVGDVGMGKSRLIEEMMTYGTDEHRILSISAACPSFGRHTPYLPWLDLLRAIFGFQPADSTQVKLEKIEALLRETDPSWRDWAALIGRLLGLDVDESDLIRALDAQNRQRTIFRILTGLIDHVASEQPLLLAIDDLQWADDTSIQLVNHVAHQVADRPLLLVLAHRGEDALSPALDVDEFPYHTDIRLEELSDEASQHLLDTLLPTTPQMPHHLRQLILDKARGNPLFIEEVAYSLIENYLTLDEESGTYHARTDLEQIEVPDSVSRVIVSRIDRLDESNRNLLRVASVIGQRFQQWLLSAIYPYRHTKEELHERLDVLSQREILDGPQPESLYLFRHILTREVAYESLLYADRRQLHRRIGESIEVQQGDRLAEYWEVLAYHFGLAEVWDKSLTYHLHAAHKAQSIYANEDAIHHFRQALKAAEKMPGSEERQLVAHEGLSNVWDTIGEYDEALDHIYRAQDLVMVAGFSPKDMARRLADLCRRTASIYRKKSQYETALNWLNGGLIALEGTQAIEVARIYIGGAAVYRRQGKNEEAIAWCRNSLDVASQIQTREGKQVMARAYYNLGGIYTRQGDLPRAVEFCRRSLALYQQIDDIVGQSQAHINLANAYFEQGNWSQVTQHYLHALDITRKIGDVYSQALITLNLGGVTLNQGDLDQAAGYYQQSLEMWQELGSTYAIALLHNNMGAVALQRDEPEEALMLLRKSLELFQDIGSSDFLPEIYRHHALAHLGRAELDEAMDCAQRSLALAREQELYLEEGIARRVLGQVHLAHQGAHIAQAERELQQSLRILKELNSRYETGKTLFQLARLHRIRGEPVKMQEHLEEAQTIFEDLGARLDLAQIQKLAPE